MHQETSKVRNRITLIQYQSQIPKKLIKRSHETLKQTFQEAFGTSKKPTYYKGKTTRLEPNEANVHVQSCMFKDCISESSGGAIFCNGSSIEKLFVSHTSFKSCKTADENAGAILYYNMESGQCVICEVCSFQCASTFSGESYGQFARVIVKYDSNDSIASINQVNDSSITQSRKENKRPYKTLNLLCGKISVQSVNLTHNECSYDSALYCVPTYQESEATSSVSCFVSYTSIVNNTADESCCINFWSGLECKPQYCIYACNIINNEQISQNDAMIQTDSQLFINCSCVIGNNKNKTLFCQKCDDYKIILTNCTIDDDVKTSSRYSGGVEIESSITIESFEMLWNEQTRKSQCLEIYYFFPFNWPQKNCVLSCKRKRQLMDPLRCIEYLFLISLLPSNPEYKPYQMED